MALNLSTLTSPATSGNVLQELTTKADFLDSVPVLSNLADPSGATDARQSVALNQPKALPLAANGKGYCYLPVTTGNAPAVTFPTIGANDDFVLEMDVYLVDASSFYIVTGESIASRLAVHSNAFYAQTNSPPLNSALADGRCVIRVERESGTITLKQDDVIKASGADTGAYDFTFLSFNGQFGTSIPPLNGYIQKATLSIEGTEELNVDFTASQVRHNDIKFQCATGQTVTINQDSSSSNDVSTIIKKPVLRFDGVDDFMDGVFNQTITDGYMFAAFSVLGDGGDPNLNNPRIFGLNSTGENDNVSGGLFISRHGQGDGIALRYNGNAPIIHDGVYDDTVGDILLESRLQAGSQISKVNNANEANGTSTFSDALSSEEFKIASFTDGNYNTAIDLEYLALFPATITDAQADDVRKYINNRNNVFYRWDTDGYYFFDPQKVDFVGNFTDVNTLDGYITGSDLGDTDVRTNLTLVQPTLNDQPSTDGYTITFNDSAEHLEFDNAASQTLAGWQVVGTSLGTFAYKVNANAVTELNLLGNLGNPSYRKAGDLYGIILLPESATSRQIEQARKLLIDRGAADASTIITAQAAWFRRYDIVEFKNTDFPDVVTLGFAFEEATNLTKINKINAPLCENFSSAFLNCSSLSDFEGIQAPVCTIFLNTWKGCSSLTSFPADAKLGTEAINVNFTRAWESSGLTSFSTPLPTAASVHFAWGYSNSLASFSSNLPLIGNASYAWYACNSLSDFRATEIPNCQSFANAWRYCSALRLFPADAKLGTEASNVNFSSAWQQSGLTSFSTPLPTATNAAGAWANCTSLTDFSADVFANWNPSSITSGVFNQTWDGCSSLTSLSVERILTSIDSSGKHGTSNGLSGGTPLSDSGIDVDYNGDPLSAATTAAITSLKSKGWSIFINSVEQ